MKIRRRFWVAVGLVLLGIATIPWLPLHAQNFPGPWSNLTAGGLVPLPPPPPQGAWGEVIYATEKWIVVQNHEGQQFPIAADAINQFLVRWPYALGALTTQSWVEAIGIDLGSNTVQTQHVDVYEGSDRTLVQPTVRSVLPTNRVVTTIDPTFQRMMNAFDIGAQNSLYGWAYPINPGTNGIPGQLYVVGSAVSTAPLLQLGVPGNNVATVVPSGGNMTISQVTRGSPSLARKGDLVFLTPVDLTPKSLVLRQAVLYKKIPLAQFNP